jgi:hypothetical protein
MDQPVDLPVREAGDNKLDAKSKKRIKSHLDSQQSNDKKNAPPIGAQKKSNKF